MPGGKIRGLGPVDDFLTLETVQVQVNYTEVCMTDAVSVTDHGTSGVGKIPVTSTRCLDTKKMATK